MANVKKRMDDLLDELSKVYEEKRLLEIENAELKLELAKP